MRKLMFVTIFGGMMLNLACSGDDKDTGETEDGEDGSDGEDSFAPQEGVWMQGDITVVSDSCNFPDDGSGEEEDAGMNLATTGDGTFSLTPADDDSVSFSCTLDGQSFSCDPYSEDIPMDGLDASMSVAQAISGEFSSASEGSVNVKTDLDCAGADCGTLADYIGTAFPCGMEISFAVTVQ